MAITSGLCNSFKLECMQGIHDLDTDDIRIALFTSAATLNKSTTTYSNMDEVVGTGYTEGGQSLASIVLALDGDTAVMDFADPTWSGSTITARGALVYNASKADRAIAVYNFGEDKSSTSGDFVVQVPSPTFDAGILRLA